MKTKTTAKSMTTAKKYKLYNWKRVMGASAVVDDEQDVRFGRYVFVGSFSHTNCVMVMIF